MDYSNHYVDHLALADTNIPGGAVIDKVASTLAHGVLVNAKSKEAQKQADAGNYWTLRPYQKSLIPIPQYILDQVSKQGITYFAVYQLPEQGTGASQTQIINDLKKMSGAPNMLGVTGPASLPLAQTKIGEPAVAEANVAGAAASAKTLLPYILGIALLGGAIYLLSHKK